MTQEEVAILWKDANGWDVKGYETTLKDLERFAKLVAAKEREALAQPEQFCDANCVWTDHHPDCKLAQPQQEPVAWMYQEYRDDDQFGWRDEILFTPPPNDPIYFRNITPVYTHPPQRQWVGLTDEEVRKICVNEWGGYEQCRAIEAKLKEKNSA
jgi:hypothetical protein